MELTTAERVVNFRQAFPEFANGPNYPTAELTVWFTVAEEFVNNKVRWKKLLELGRQLFVAHNLVMNRRNQDAVANGGIPGEATGPVNNKSVDKVSVGYDVNAAAIEGAGNWNLTSYGQRYIQIARMVGIGGLQIGIGCGPAYGAWTGPWSGNFPNMNE